MGMGTWIVKTNGNPDDEPLFIISNVDGGVSLHMPSPEPVVVTTRKLEEIRWATGAALTDTRPDPELGTTNVDV